MGKNKTIPPKPKGKGLAIQKKIRNENEKHRRDMFNQLIGNLGNAILAQANEQNRLSKCSILRQALLFLKEQKTKFISPTQSSRTIKEDLSNLNWKPSDDLVTTEEWFELAIESMNCFLLIIHFNSIEDNQIVYISNHVYSYLGYSQDQLLSHSLFQFIHPSNHQKLKDYFSNHPTVLRPCDVYWKQSMNDDDYEQCTLIGTFRKFNENENYYVSIVKVNTLDRTRCLDENSSGKEFVIHINNHGRIIYINSTAEEYLGYNSFELLHKTYFELVHPDDLSIISRAHQLWKANENIKSDPYRLLTKGQQWIFLQTSSQKQTNSWTGKTDFFICTNYLLNSSTNCLQTTNRLNSKDTENNSSTNEIQAFLCDINDGDNRKNVLQKLNDLKKIKEAEIRVRKDEIQVIDDIITFINQYRTPSTPNLVTEEALLDIFDYPNDLTIFNSPLSGSIEDYLFSTTRINPMADDQ